MSQPHRPPPRQGAHSILYPALGTVTPKATARPVYGDPLHWQGTGNKSAGFWGAEGCSGESRGEEGSTGCWLGGLPRSRRKAGCHRCSQRFGSSCHALAAGK